MDKLIYQEIYPTIEEELSCSNVGGRRGRNIRDHLFVLYSIFNEVKSGQGECIDTVSIDIHKCFDELMYSETHNDLYDTNIKDDKFALMAKLDEEAIVKVKTPVGLTPEFHNKKSHIPRFSVRAN